MPVTVSLDHELLAKAKSLAEQSGKPIDAVMISAIRAGLDKLCPETKTSRYRTKGHRMGLRKGYSLDNIQELLSRIEGEQSR